MALAGKTSGKALSFTIDDAGGSVRDISGDVLEVSGLPGEVLMSDATTGGSTGVKSIGGLQKCSFTVRCIFSDAADTGSWTVLGGFGTDTATETRSFVFCPAGSSSGYPKISGECKIKSIDFPAKPSEVLSFTANCEADNGVTVATV